MIKLYKFFSWCVVGIIPTISFAGQVAVVNPGAASGVAVVMTPVVTGAPTVATPTVVTAPAVAAPTVTAPTVTAPTGAGATATTPISTAPATNGSPTQSERNARAAPSAPTSVSGYAPQVVVSMQSMNVSTFTPQQVSTLISSIDALISQPGTITDSVRQALLSERARLSAIASQ